MTPVFRLDGITLLQAPRPPAGRASASDGASLPTGAGKCVQLCPISTHMNMLIYMLNKMMNKKEFVI